MAQAILAGGCFWCTEAVMNDVIGVSEVESGYIGGDVSDPTYKQVCSGTTGHAESVRVRFDPERIDYETLVRFFFRIHDPTTLNRQGPDQGTQYRSAIFTHDESQSALAHKTREEFQKSFWKDQIKTHIEPIQNWWDAEQYHQLYLDKNPDGYECPTHYVRTSPQL